MGAAEPSGFRERITMKLLGKGVLLFTLFLCAASVWAAANDRDLMMKDDHPVTRGWRRLINARGMADWRGEPEYWKIEEGVVIGSSPGGPHHHYLTTKRDYSDFVLQVDVKMIGYNSGVCIRGEYLPDTLGGYQVDMGEGFWGCLWDEGKHKMVSNGWELGQKLLHKDDWNHYAARAVGHHIEMWLNGVKTVDAVDEAGRLTGPIGFQLCHGGKTDVWFKNFYLKEIR
jgi:hypothetical protein